MVDGLKKEYEGRAEVLRADIMSGTGRTLAKRYRIDTVPGFVVLDMKGHVVLRRNGAGGVPLKDLRHTLDSLIV